MFDFGTAITNLKIGEKVTREGWNGKNMYLYYQLEKIVKKNQENITYLPYIVMKTADDKHVPWLASQTDILSNDWGIL